MQRRRRTHEHVWGSEGVIALISSGRVVVQTGTLLILGGCGASVCTDEFVSIQDADDLRALGSCTHVQGNLDIQADNLTSLQGLERLTVVEGFFRLTANDALTDLSGLEGLTSVGAELFIESNRSLATLRLPALTTVKGQFSISSNETLASLSLPLLTTVGGGLFLSSNEALQTLAGLEHLSSIGGNLVINANAALTDVSALGGVTQVPADLLVSENPALLSLSLQGLTSVGAGRPSPTSMGPSSRQLFVSANPALTRLDLPALGFVGAGGLRIHNNIALAQCQADALAKQAAKACECSGNTGTDTCN